MAFEFLLQDLMKDPWLHYSVKLKGRALAPHDDALL